MKKPWHKQKTTWMGLISIAGGIAMCIFSGPAVGVPMIINGAGFIFGRQAIEKAIK